MDSEQLDSDQLHEDVRRPAYLSYLLRLWREGNGGEVIWRASLEDAQTPAQVLGTKKESYLQVEQLSRLVAYNVLLTVIFAPVLIFLIVQQSLPALLTTLITVLVAGTLGGTLCNLRGLFTHPQMEDGQFPARLKIPFYIRPVTGSLTGLFTFCMGSLLVTSLSLDSATQGWVTLEGRLPYIAIAILSGFASQEFMERLRLVASTLFAETEAEERFSKLEKQYDLNPDRVVNE